MPQGLPSTAAQKHLSLWHDNALLVKLSIFMKVCICMHVIEHTRLVTFEPKARVKVRDG